MLLSMCWLNLETHQKVLMSSLECCLDDLNWQQSSFQLEKISFTQCKQSVLIVLITVRNHLQDRGNYSMSTPRWATACCDGVGYKLQSFSLQKRVCLQCAQDISRPWVSVFTELTVWWSGHTSMGTHVIMCFIIPALEAKSCESSWQRSNLWEGRWSRKFSLVMG